VAETGRKHRVARVLATLLAFSLMVSALLYLFLGNTAVAQQWRSRRALRHQAVIERALASDARFGGVKIGFHTTDGGASLLIAGTLAESRDLDALKEIVNSTEPPCHVAYRVLVPPK
jgi:hypothetical protein